MRALIAGWWARNMCGPVQPGDQSQLDAWHAGTIEPPA
jgi:hypothetical protein